MRTLFLARDVPWPLNVGVNLRAYHLLKALTEVSQVTFVSSTRGHEHARPLETLCHETFFYPYESTGWCQDVVRSRPVQLTRSILQYCDPREPVLVKAHKSGDATRLVHDLTSRHFDLVWVEHASSIQFLPSPIATRVIVDLDDLEHRKLVHKFKRSPFYRRFPLELLEFIKLRRFERRLTSLSCELAVSSDTDWRVLGSPPRTWIVPNGIDVPAPSADRAERAVEPIFVFVGAMSYEPNVDAVHFFTRRIFPIIKPRLPGARFLIVGRDPDPSVVKLHDGESVLVTGTVATVEPYLQRAAVAVVPLRFGSGTRIKILEALAHRVPVVTTTIGAEGLDVQSGRHLLMADGAWAFAHACLWLLHDHPLRNRLTEQGYRLVVDKYDWASIERHVQTMATMKPIAESQISETVETDRAQGFHQVAG